MGYHTTTLQFDSGLVAKVAHWDDWGADATIAFSENDMQGERVVTLPGHWLIELGRLVYGGEIATWFAHFARHFIRKAALPLEATFLSGEAAAVDEGRTARLQLDAGAVASVTFSLRREQNMVITYTRKGKADEVVRVPGDWLIRVV